MTRRNLKVPVASAAPSVSRPNVFDPNCDSRQVLALITHRWTVLIIYALGATTKRHGELKAMIGGVSQKMLTQTLRQLEHDGIVARTDHGEMPPRVDYSLTPLGLTLLDTLGAICRWAESHLPEVRLARGATAAPPDPGPA
jgi:DNA-binding HxlR family transcriptional regulator